MRYAHLAVLLAIVSGCASTKLNTTWKEPSAGALSFNKVVVVVLNSTPADRRAQEDQIAGFIKRATAVPSYTIVPDAELANREAVKRAIIQSGADGAVVMRMIESRKEVSYVPGTVSYWNDGTGAYAPYHRSPGYYVTDTVVRAEVSLYSVPEGKLLWAGASSTTNPKDVRDFTMQTARAAADELRKQKLLN